MHHDNLHTAPMPASQADAALDARRATRRKRFLVFFAAVLLAAIAWLAVWWLRDRYYEETDDAYVAGSIVQISAQVPGTVIDVLAGDTHPVRAGQVLVRLDDTEASVAFAQAKAQLAQAVRQVANAKISNTMYVEAVNARRADLALAQRALAARAGAS
ncbi:TPA: biotin/lipoyl-binding protein, partial [Burkholderia cenocepacia]|nr:biotin/lipoyl-binding protein [Burkholderia cenocepacia]